MADEEFVPMLILPVGYRLVKRKDGTWDVDPPEGADMTNAVVLGTLTELRCDIEAQLSPAPQDDQAPPPPPDDNDAPPPWNGMDQNWILQCMNRNVTGDAELYAAMHTGRLAINITTGGDRKTPETLQFTGHHWQMDPAMVFAHSQIESVALAYGHAHQVTTVATFKERIKGLEEQIDNLAAGANEDKDLIEDEIDKIKKRLAGRTKSVTDRMHSLRSPTRESAIITKARSIAGFPLNCESSWLDNKSNLLPVANGVVDLETGEHRDGTPEDWMVRSAPVEWRGAGADRGAWEEFLGGVYADPDTGEPYVELIRFIQRLMGYALLGGTPNHILPILTGRGRNGKSTLLNTIHKVLGPLAGGLPSELLLDQGVSRSADSPTPSIMSLKGLRLAWASETAEGRKFSIERVKWLTGGDPLTGRHPNDKYPTTFAPTHLMFLLTNNLPSAPATDYAFWKRVLAIPHKISFVHGEPTQTWEKPIDPDMDAKLDACLPGILAWLVEGHMAWRRDGLAPPSIVTDATNKYREGEDVLGEFLYECCEVNETLHEGSSKLYTVFEQFYQKNVGKYVPSQKKFGGWMEDKGFERRKSGTIRYYGVALKLEHLEAYSPKE